MSILFQTRISRCFTVHCCGNDFPFSRHERKLIFSRIYNAMWSRGRQSTFWRNTFSPFSWSKCSSETSFGLHLTTRRYITDEITLCNHLWENFKCSISYILCFLVMSKTICQLRIQTYAQNPVSRICNFIGIKLFYILVLRRARLAGPLVVPSSMLPQYSVFSFGTPLPGHSRWERDLTLA